MRICLTDYQPLVLTMLGDFLRDLGHEVFCANSGEQMLQALDQSEKPIDLVIADLEMPGCSGNSLVRKLHELFPKIPIILMTGAALNLSPQDALASGVQAFLRKPIWLSELELLLARISHRDANGKVESH